MAGGGLDERPDNVEPRYYAEGIEHHKFRFRSME